jgi:hypothetical protein
VTTENLVREKRRDTYVRISLIGLLVLVTLIYFVVAILKPRTIPDNFTNSYTGAPGGHLALVELLQDHGYFIERSKARLELPEDRFRAETLMVLEPRLHDDERFRGDFRTTVRDAQSRNSSFVLALPKRRYFQNWQTQTPGVVEVTETAVRMGDVVAALDATEFGNWLEVVREPSAHHRVLTAGGAGVELQDFIQLLRLRSGVRTLPDHIEPILQTSSGYYVALRLRAGSRRDSEGFVLVSDPDMFSNRFIAEPGMASLAMTALEHIPPGQTIIIDETLHGLADEAGVEYLAATAPGLWVTLSVILLLLLFAWREGTVLRPLSLESNPRDRRLYAIEGLARMMRRTNAHHEAAESIRRRGALVLSEGVIRGGGLSKEELDALHQEYVMGGDAASELIYAAQAVSALKRRQYGNAGQPEHKADT